MKLPELGRQGLGSPFAEQLKQGFTRLRFERLLEKEFRDFYVAMNLPRGRLGLAIALIVVLLVSGVDFVFGQFPLNERLNAARLGVIAPLLALTAGATYVPALQRYYMSTMAVGVLCLGLVAVYLCQLASLQGAPHMLAGLLLAVLYACTFLGLMFKTALLVSSVLVAAYVASGLLLGLPTLYLLYGTAMLATATAVGGISTYHFERAMRTNFLETRFLNELAERDGLTGLYNRRIFDDYMRRVWRQSRREDVAVQVIFIDIDYFKIYNDLYGHQAGDDCLKSVARTIARSAKRPFDFCARYGGEEFVLVLYGPPQDYARTLPEQIRQDVLDMGVPHEGSQAAGFVTVSVGVALAPPGSNRSLTGTIQAADEALYQAKQEGRNRVAFRDVTENVETGNFRVSIKDAVS